MKIFGMTDLDLLHYFLGIEVKQGENEIFISQRKYTTDLLKRFKISNCKVIATLINANEKLRLEDGTEMATSTLVEIILL